MAASEPRIVVSAGGSGAAAARKLAQPSGPGGSADAVAAASASARAAAGNPGTDTERSNASATASTPTVRLSARSAASAGDGKEKTLDAKDASAKGSAKKRKKSKSKSKTRKPKDSADPKQPIGLGADAASGSLPPADGAAGVGAGGVAAGGSGVTDGGDPNSGLCACFLTRKAVEKWDLGVGISAAAMPGGVIYKKLSKAALLADINESGPESEFHSLSKQIKACPFDEILFIREDNANTNAGVGGGADGGAGAGADGVLGGGVGGSAGGPAETGVYDYKFCTTETALQREWARIQALEKAFEAKANATGSSGGGGGGLGATQPGVVGYGVDPKDNKTGSGGSSTALTAWDPQSPFRTKAAQVAATYKVSEGVEDAVKQLHVKRKRGGVGQFGIPSAASLSGAPAVGSAAAVAAAAAAAAASAGSSGGPAPSGVPLPPIGYFITQPRFQFAAPYEFSDTAEVVSGFPHKSLARWNIERKELSMGFQAAATRVDASTQTHWARAVHKITQYEPNTMTDDEAARVMADPRMEHFLNAFVDPTPARAKRPGDVTDKLMTLALEQNETIDLFKDEFREFADDDSQIGQKADNTLKDAGAYTHSKANQNICAIDWHPSQSKTSVVAFCCAHNLTFDRWVDSHSGKVLSSQIMFVNFSSDIVKPHITCEAPGNVLCFQLNPTNPNVVAAGLMTGQVMFWDISDRAEKAYAATVHASAASASSSSAAAAAANGANGGSSSRGQKEAAGSSAGATHRTFDEYGGTGGTESTNFVKPRAMSYIDKSHSRPVTDVRWLPAGVEITRRGEVVRNSKSKVSHQFVTASGDGTISFWDVRLRDIYKTGTAEDQEATAEPKWMPAYTIALTKPDRSGVLAATKVALGLDTKMFVVTEDGEVATVDWSLAKMDEKDKVTTLAVTSVRRAHLQPCTGVERCPHFPDIYLSVGDWSFIVWQDGVDDPLFVSPPINAENQLVAARWSPTRAGVIITALSSGYVEIWDLMDQTHHHSFSFKCSENSIASLEFWRSRVVIDPKHGPVANPYLQYLAVGDVTGRLRLLQMPKNLRKKQDMREERNLIRQFFDREIARAAYAKKRAAVRAAERKAAEEAQHLIDLQNQERLQQLQSQAALIGGPAAAAALGLTGDGKAPGTADASRAASALGIGAGLGATASAKEQKALAARRKQEALEKAKEERAAEERKRIEAEDAEEREYQALLEHYKKQFSDENFAAKLTVNLAAAAPLNVVKPDAPPAAAQPMPSARVKF